MLETLELLGLAVGKRYFKNQSFKSRNGTSWGNAGDEVKWTWLFIDIPHRAPCRRVNLVSYCKKNPSLIPMYMAVKVALLHSSLVTGCFMQYVSLHFVLLYFCISQSTFFFFFLSSNQFYNA